ncbi:hypothetical protein ASE01_02430 [Nocardioides sp. Root190]|nr:hypothetical protein ASE01_02430 [Nocardioides sp. Root190]
MRSVVLGVVLVVAGLTALPAASGAAATSGPTVATPVARAAAAPTTLTRTVVRDGRSLTVRLRRVSTRAPGFAVLVQQANGSLTPVAAPAERSYLGTVDGVPGASAGAVLRSDGKVEGLVVFDRGGTWHFLDGAVVGTRGLTQPASHVWPSADDAARNVTVTPGQVGSKTYRWSIGYDLANRWFSHAGTIDSSVAKALDAVELTTVMLQLAYETDARLRPATGRVVVRGSATAEPYAGYEDLLGKVREEWRTTQADSGVDAVALWHGSSGGGGVAYVSTIAGDYAVSSNGGTGTPWVVTRHELGHVWGAHDNHTNGPEGATIESGNQFHRFDGTELSAILRLRNDRLARATSPLEVVATQTAPLPPYAALDLVTHQVSGSAFSFRPTSNDHDANGQRVSLRSVGTRSHLGGWITRSGDVVTYVPPSVTTRTTDVVRYVATDSTGRTATGVVLFQVDPRPAATPVSAWPDVSLAPASGYAVVNVQSGLHASRDPGGPAVQRTASTVSGPLSVRRTSSGNEFRRGQDCLTARADARVRFQPCTGVAAQRFRVVQHPVKGSAIVSRAYRTCVRPAGASMSSGAALVHGTCGLGLSMGWTLRAPAVTTWRAAAVPTGPRSLVQLGSGRPAGVPAGATGNSTLAVIEPAGTATQVTFLRNDDGTYRIRNARTERCFDAYGSDLGGEVGTWSCGVQDNQRWRILTNPAGGVSLRLVRGGLCLGVADRLVDTGLTLRACNLAVAVRWRIGA